jgi:hypothetical protein
MEIYTREKLQAEEKKPTGRNEVTRKDHSPWKPYMVKLRKKPSAREEATRKPGPSALTKPMFQTHRQEKPKK